MKKQISARLLSTMDKIQPNHTLLVDFIGLPGEWNIAMATQRQADYDLNYVFTSKVANAPSTSLSTYEHEYENG